MIKVNIVDHSTMEVMDNFKPADVKELPADLVNFIKKLPKGDKLKPLDKDTFLISTYKTSPRRIYAQFDVPAERNVELHLPKDENCAYYACLTDNTKKLEENRKGFYPISVKGLKEAIRNIMRGKDKV